VLYFGGLRWWPGILLGISAAWLRMCFTQADISPSAKRPLLRADP
jgi:hypothetical protein